MRIEDLNQQPIILIVYHSGSSGEFFAHALSQSLYTVTYPEVTWENQTRCKFGDFFGRSCNGGSETMDNELVLKRINLFFESAVEIKQHHIALAHPTASSIDFIKQYLPDIPIIEISIIKELSKKFKFYAANSKIPAENRRNIPTSFQFDWKPQHCAKKHLYIEWSDLILTDTANAFNKIKEFLNIDGDTDKFLQMVENYKTRNLDILKSINAI